MYRYTVLLYTTCKDELYFCEHNSYKQDTHTNIALYIYRFTTGILYTTCTDELSFCEQNTYKRDTHTHTDIALYIYRLYI